MCGKLVTVPVFVVKDVVVPTVSTLKVACGSGKIGPVIPAVDAQSNANPSSIISSSALNP